MKQYHRPPIRPGRAPLVIRYQAERAQPAPEPSSELAPLRERLDTAAHRLRYEAILEAAQHMGADVAVQEYRDYATCTRAGQFAAVRPVSTGEMVVGLAIDPSTDERLVPCLGRWGSDRIVAQFTLAEHQPLRGWHMGLLRRAYNEAG